MKVVMPSCKNLLLNSSLTILFFSILFQSPLSVNNMVFSSTVNDSADVKLPQLDPDRNIITSQNTGNSKSNTNDESQNQEQEQASNISLKDEQPSEETTEIPQANREGASQSSAGQQQSNVEIHP